VTTTWRLSPVVENTSDKVTSIANAGIVTSHVPNRSAAAQGPATHATSSIPNLDAAEKLESSGLSNFLVAPLLSIDMKLAGGLGNIQ